MSDLDIVQIQTRSELKQFIDLPWKIYPRDCLWVPPLKRQVRKLLDTRKHPFWKFSEQALFLARRGAQVVGRVAGIIDNNHNRYHNEQAGAWGFFECQNDQEAARCLLSAVEDWARSKGMTLLRGPLNPSTNYEVGTLVEGFEYPPTVMMPWNYPYYASLVEGSGFQKEKDLLALQVLTHQYKIGDRIRRLTERIKKKGKIWSRNGSKKHVESEMSLIAEIYRSAWAENWGFVPMTDEENRVMAKELLPVMVEELTFFLYYGDQPAGVAMVMLDVNPLLKRLNGKIGITGLVKYILYRKEIRGLRGAVFGVKKEYRNLGLPLVAFDHLYNVLEGNDKYDYLEFGWNLEDNDAINKFELEAGAKVYKRYRVFKKDL
jgi:hypothetical protein